MVAQIKMTNIVSKSSIHLITFVCEQIDQDDVTR